jgi:hypothetical protein
MGARDEAAIASDHLLLLYIEDTQVAFLLLSPENV